MGERLTASAEDYLEAALILSREKRVVRVKDIAGRLGVSKPSVNNAVKCLKENGLVRQEKYGDIELTANGKRRAAKIYDTHVALMSFFGGVLNMDGETAEADACAIEHYISPATLKRLLQFISFIEHGAAGNGALKAEFANYCDGNGARAAAAKTEKKHVEKPEASR